MNTTMDRPCSGNSTLAAKCFGSNGCFSFDVSSTWLAAWAIVNESSKLEFAVGRRERKDALNALRASFGKSISDGPKKGQNELEIAAATMAYFLTQDLQSIAHPRSMSPH